MKGSMRECTKHNKRREIGNVFNRNLRYFRLKKGLTQEALAERVNVAPVAIMSYESGRRKPDMEILKRLAETLDIRISDFLAVRSEDMVFTHSAFRKNSKPSLFQQEFLYETVEEYFNRFMTVVDILDSAVLPDAPVCHALILTKNDEKNAASLREYLGFAKDDPLKGLMDELENKGILIHE